MRSVAVDNSRWPLLVVKYHGVLRDEDLSAYLAAMDENLARCATAKASCAILLDAQQGGMSNASQRKMQSDWIAQNRARCATHCAGYAFVIPSMVVRGMLQAILWLSPLPAEHCVVATVQEAESWLLERLAKSRDVKRAA